MESKPKLELQEIINCIVILTTIIVILTNAEVLA